MCVYHHQFDWCKKNTQFQVDGTSGICTTINVCASLSSDIAKILWTCILSVGDILRSIQNIKHAMWCRNETKPVKYMYEQCEHNECSLKQWIYNNSRNQQIQKEHLRKKTTLKIRQRGISLEQSRRENNGKFAKKKKTTKPRF